MIERPYTVREIDELRSACEARWLWGTTVLRSGCSRSYKEDEKAKCVEEAVRTHMIAGHVAQDIYDEDNKRAAEPVSRLAPPPSDRPNIAN